MLHLIRGILARLMVMCVLALSACVKPQPTKVSPPATAPPRVALHPTKPLAKPGIEAQLHTAGRMLEQLIADPANAVPDGILNRTTCFALFPHAGETSGPVTGFASCRNSSELWTSPAVAAFSPEMNSEIHGDLLVFLLSDRARHELIQGSLAFDPELSAAPGPLVREHPTLDQVELGKDAFVYVRSGTGFRGEALDSGSVTLNAAETSKLYGHAVDPTRLLDNSTMSSTLSSFFNIDVGSFFNEITPVGIIVHHSVLTPSGHTNPEDVLDQFHSGRGYEISCFGKTYHIAYHYLILRTGKVQPGRPERCEGAHARGYNSYLGIALIGNFTSSRPTSAQMRSLIRLCRELRAKYNIPIQHIMPHSAVARTRCPGDQLHFTRVLAALEEKTSSGL